MDSDDRNLVLLKRRIFLDRGFDCDQYKESYLKRRISVRMRATGSRDYLSYMLLLKKHPEEYRYLMDEITINVTQFFRDKDVYSKITDDLVPRIIDARQKVGSRSLRVWSAGCASGEEPYSVAILLDHFYGERLKDWNVRIVGSDFDVNSLKKAKKGIYDNVDVLEGMDKARYFENIGGEEPAFRVRDKYRQMVRFEEINLFKDHRKRQCDIVMFRNVLIYFDRKNQSKIIGSVASALTPEGFLVLGKSETLGHEIRNRFDPVFPRERIFQLKKGIDFRASRFKKEPNEATRGLPARKK